MTIATVNSRDNNGIRVKIAKSCSLTIEFEAGTLLPKDTPDALLLKDCDAKVVSQKKLSDGFEESGANVTVFAGLNENATYSLYVRKKDRSELPLFIDKKYGDWK